MTDAQFIANMKGFVLELAAASRKLPPGHVVREWTEYRLFSGHVLPPHLYIFGLIIAMYLVYNSNNPSQNK
jgi:hypothetical protein